jgi:hypothetical protein
MTSNDSYSPQVDKSTFSVRQSFDETDDKTYWMSRTPDERLQHMEFLRRINYGEKATARIQKVLEIDIGPG